MGSSGWIGFLFAYLACLTLEGVLAFWFAHGAWASDTWTYQLAGQRLNTGGQIYDLRPSDFFYVAGPPLYGPPLVAVLWRPIAALGTAGMLGWWLLMAFSTVWAVALMLVELPVAAGLVVTALSIALVQVIGVGNVDGVVLLGMVAAWRYRDRAGVVGVILGFIVSLKLTPAYLVLWLVATGRYRAVAYAALTGLGLLVLTSALANDPVIVGRYLGVMGDGMATGATWSRFVLPIGAAVVLLVARRWPSAGFAVAVALIPLASPVAQVHTLAILLAALAPWTGQTTTRVEETTATRRRSFRSGTRQAISLCLSQRSVDQGP